MKYAHLDQLNEPRILEEFLQEHGESTALDITSKFSIIPIVNNLMRNLDLYGANSAYPSVGFALVTSGNTTESHRAIWDRAWKDYLVEIQLTSGIIAANGVKSAFTLKLTVTCLKTFKHVVIKTNLTVNGLIKELDEVKRNIFRTIK